MSELPSIIENLVNQPLTISKKEEEVVQPPYSSLILRSEQEKRVVERICKKIEDLQRTRRDWVEKRNSYVAQHHNDFEWRVKEGNIFSKSNLTFNLSRRVATAVSAQLIKGFVGKDPYFNVKAIGAEDEQLAREVERMARYKLGRSKLKSAITEAIEDALVVGEAVVKITHADDAMFFKRSGAILVDGAGMPITTPDGDIIFEGEPFAQDPATGQIVLASDRRVIIPMDYRYEMGVQAGRKTIYKGTDVRVLHYADFLCPLNAADIHEADFCAHLYDQRLNAVARKWIYSIAPDAVDTPAKKAFLKELAHRINNLKSETSLPKSEEKKSVFRNGEIEEPNDHDVSVVQLAEVYMREDVDDDGVFEDVYMVVDLKNKVALFYDYTANITPDGRRPFEVVRCTPARHRWYGLSEYEVNASRQEFVDWAFNRLVYENSITGAIRGYDPNAAEEWETEEPQAGDKLYRIRDPERFKNGIITLQVPPVSDNLWQFAEYLMQNAQLDSGNVQPGEQQLAGVPAAKLAAGIRAIERASGTISALRDIRIDQGVSKVIEAALKCMLAHLDQEEEYSYFEGSSNITARISREDVVRLHYMIETTTDVTEAESALQKATTAANLVVQYYQLPPIVQPRVTAFYADALRALDVADPERALVPVQPMEMMQPMPQEGMPQEGQPPSGQMQQPQSGMQQAQQGEAQPVSTEMAGMTQGVANASMAPNQPVNI
jgi:hypothetical protein